jgi:hypothetical protein
MKFSIKILFLSFLLSNVAYAQTASILPNAETVFLDQNGKPLTSGSVTFSIPGTTTPKTTWQDAAETIPNANPVILDGAGRALILGSGSYRQIVKDRNNNLIWDQVTSSTGSGGGGGTTATGDGDLVGTIKPWAGMTAPNQYMFAFGSALSRTTFSALFTAITSSQAIFCISGSAVLTGLGDTTNFWIGMPVEVSCVVSGQTTIIAKTSTTVTMAVNSNLSTNTTATFFPWGNGDGSSTFNLPDFRGFAIAGNNNMGGVASSNLTTQFFATNPNSTGAAGGSQSVTLLAANLPPYTPSGTVTVTPPTTTNVPETTTTISTGQAALSSSTSAFFPSSANGWNTVTGTFSGTFTGSPQGGTSTPFSLIQPTKTANYIIKVTPDTNSATASGVTSLGGMTGDIACGSGLNCSGNIISVAGGGSGVTSVSNSDSTLTVSPTAGAVVASLNLAHANTWAGVQTLTTPNIGAATGTSLTLSGAATASQFSSSNPTSNTGGFQFNGTTILNNNSGFTQLASPDGAPTTTGAGLLLGGASTGADAFLDGSLITFRNLTGSTIATFSLGGVAIPLLTTAGIVTNTSAGLLGTTPLGSGVAAQLANAVSTAGGSTTTIAAGTAVLGTSAIGSGSCATTVTVSAPNVTTTDVVTASFNGSPIAITGYIPATSGMLTIIVFPTSGDANFDVCNNTSASITPGAITLNWRVVR